MTDSIRPLHRADNGKPEIVRLREALRQAERELSGAYDFDPDVRALILRRVRDVLGACRCQGDGATWVDRSDCPLHENDPSRPGEQGTIATQIVWYEEALRAIRGSSDGGVFMDAYRQAGGGYEGLQAIATEALRDA